MPIPDPGLFEGLISTKITPPRLRASRVFRQRLIERFGPESQENVVVLMAPAGFGKTILLAEWAERNKAGLAWVSLDEGDDDPGLFWSYVGAALIQANVAVSQRGIAMLTAISEISIEHALAPLLADLAAGPGPVTLILDDYHAISSQRIHRSMAFFLDHVPHRFRIVFGTRTDLPFPTARLRARGRLLEINAAGLRFTESEAADLFRSATSSGLPPDRLQDILRETEGWAMGLRAAAMALVSTRTFGENVGPYTPEMLRREVFSDLPREAQEFLVKSSFLDRLNPELCDFVLQRSDSAHILVQLERSDAFMTALDETQTWYRMHPLFAQPLREEFDRLPVGERRECHRRAAEWLASRSQWESAIRHALDGEDWTRAIRLIAQLGRFNVPTNRPETFRAWLSRIPREFLVLEPGACVQLARTMMFGNLHSDYESLLQIAESGLRASDDAGMAASVYSVRSQGECFRGDQEKAIALANAGIALLPETETLNRGVLRQIQAVCFMLSDRVSEAEAATMQAFQKSISAGNALTACLALGMRSFVNLRRARVPAALRYVAQADNLANSTGLAGLYILPFYRSRIEIECLRLDEAERALQEAEDTFDRTGNKIFLSSVYLIQAKIRWMRGRAGDALECLAVSEEAERSLGGIQDLFTARTLRLKIALDRREWAGVESLLARDPRPEGYENRKTRLKAAALLALERGDRTSASAFVAELLDLAKRAVSVGLGSDAMCSYVAAAALQYRLGAENAALGHTMRAIRIGSQGKMLGPFWEDRTALRRIFDEARLDSNHASFVSELMHRLYEEPGPLPGAQGAALSLKETEVVRLLSQGYSNEAIAEMANISANTVKTHLKHIYAKLDVSNRTQAVAAARTLGLA